MRFSILIQPLLLVLDFHGDVFFGEVGEVFGDHGLNFHLEAVLERLLDFLLPRTLAREPVNAIRARSALYHWLNIETTAAERPTQCRRLRETAYAP